MENDTSIRVNDTLVVPLAEIALSAIRAQGAGGQNVNKVSTAIHLRFDIAASASFSDDQKARLLAMSDHRISRKGLVTIKAQRYRSQDKNRRDALQRLIGLLQKGLQEMKPRKKSRPSKKAKQKWVDDKTKRGRLKASRSKPAEH